ncbi:TPA: exonuclease SbcCD subunit D [Candidatus Woesearchaeota archaeon]|nr:exonuclease SbcCD subunit D [Candidatus Woesearchaeota archaeon]
MKFAHLADCHIGAWRDPKLRAVSNKAFEIAIDKCIEEKVDFVLISGDLFNTSLPSIDSLRIAAAKFRELKDNDIPVYAIAGSHDFSPSGKTLIDVLESAGLLVNVVKGRIVESVTENNNDDNNKTTGTTASNSKLLLNFTVDKKTGAKITGLLGKRGMLDRAYYEALDVSNLENEDGFKIFMFHTALTELKPKDLEKMDSSPISFLPKGFEYYAGGHVHIVANVNLQDSGYKNVVYPGPLFPNNFTEIEKLKHGGFYIYDNGLLIFKEVKLHEAVCIELNCEHKTPQQVEQMLRERIDELNKDSELNKTPGLNNAIVTIRLSGKLESGKVSEINFNEVFNLFYSYGPYFVMKNTNALETTQLTEITIDASKPEEIEENLINEHLGKIKVSAFESSGDETAMDERNNKERRITHELLVSLGNERGEGEKVADFESRVREEVMRVLDI